MKRRGPFPLVLLAFLFTFATVGSIFASDSAYTFSFNGRPVTPEHYSLNGDASVFAPGDVIYVGDEEFAKLAEESQGPDKDLLNKAIQLLREKGSKAPAGKEHQ